MSLIGYYTVIRQTNYRREFEPLLVEFEFEFEFEFELEFTFAACRVRVSSYEGGGESLRRGLVLFLLKLITVNNRLTYHLLH